MKIKRNLALLVGILFAVLAISVVDSTINPGNPVQASTISFPKNMRGHWKSKPVYTYEEKHINKWMAIPAINMKVTAKKATWHYVGYLPKGFGYNHKKYVLRMYSDGLAKGHGPFRRENSFERRGKKLFLFYHGGVIEFNRAR